MARTRLESLPFFSVLQISCEKVLSKIVILFGHMLAKNKLFSWCWEHCDGVGGETFVHEFTEPCPKKR